MTPSAVIPMNTPEEALDELEHAVVKLGMKTVTIGTCVRRPIPKVAQDWPEAAAPLQPGSTMLLGIGSDYDYDPVWKRCVELRVPVAAHTGSVGWGARNQTNNYVYNHVGHFAAASEAFCKALILGGVVQRFPTLRFAFWEGGVGWAPHTSTTT